MSYQMTPPKFQEFDSVGLPLAGGKVYVYSPGTTTPLDSYPTFTDAEASTNANANPVILDSVGRAAIFTNTAAKIKVTDSADVELYTLDNLPDATGSAGAGSIDTAALATGAVTEAKIATGAVTAAKIGAGAVTAAKIGTDAVTSVKIQDGAVTAAKIAINSVDGTKIAVGSDAQGDVLYYNGTDYARLGSGTAGRKLKTNGAAANPSWGDESKHYFEVEVAADINNVTGDGTEYTIVFDTELHDWGSNFNISTGVFTAPVAGVYLFTGCVFINSDASFAHDLWLDVGGSKKLSTNYNALIFSSTTFQPHYVFSHLIRLSQSDTVRMKILSSSGTKIVDIKGGATRRTRLAGILMTDLTANT